MLRICSLIVRTLAMGALIAGPVLADVRGAARVIDGDTLEVADTRIRLFGIDAPEMDQPCGDWACGPWSRDALTALIGGRRVTCERVDTDRYGRMVARCFAGELDLAAAMVQAGAALAYRDYSEDYVAPESLARAARRGVWRDGSDGVTHPSDFRAALRNAEAAQARASAPAQGRCAIKGNVSSNGRIYHVPGQRDYDRTRIDTSRGERWFCTEDEARAAGWRRAQR